MKLFKLKKLNAFGVSHMIIPVLAVLVIGGIGTYLLGINHADTVSPNPNANFLYYNGKDGYIYSSTAAGVSKQLVYGGTPVYINNGTQIVFSGYFGQQGLFVMNADGNNVKKLANGNISNVIWSEATQQIAYTVYSSKNTNTNSTLYVRSLSGPSKKIYGSGAKKGITGIHGIVFSPDGKRILINTSMPPRPIYIINSDGTGLVNLSAKINPTSSGSEVLSWSPDGTQIVFVMNYNNLVVADTSTFKTKVLYTGPAEGGTTGNLTDLAKWSPDGTQIVFEYISATGTASLNSFTVSTKKVKTLATFSTTNPGILGIQDYDWSPDSTKLIAVYRPDNMNVSSSLDLINIAQAKATTLYTSTNTFGGLDWSNQ